MRALLFTRRLWHIPRWRVLFMILMLLVAPMVALASLAEITTNTGLTLNEGATATITNAMLNSTADGAQPRDMTYQVTRTPNHGTLQLKRPGLRPDFVVPQGFRLTQDEINNNTFSYTHDGSATTADSFDFAVANGSLPTVTRQPFSYASDTNRPAMSANGRVVAFASAGFIAVVDRQSGNARQLFTSPINGGERQSSNPSLSADGHIVAATVNRSMVLVWNVQTNAKTLIKGSNPSLSADGRYVAFESADATLVSGDTNNATDVFVHDTTTSTTVRASVDSNGTQANNTYSYAAAISANGRFVAFISSADNLVTGDTNNSLDSFVHDLQSGQTTRVSVASDGTQANTDFEPDRSFHQVTISADGRYVAFNSYASNLVTNDTNTISDIFLHDRATHQTTRVSVASDGSSDYEGAFGPGISADGRWVAFSSGPTNLVGNDTNGVADIFIYDTQDGTTRRISVAADGTQGNGDSSYPAISGDGHTVVFVSQASNLVRGDTDNLANPFVYDAGAPGTFPITIASINDAPTFGTLADQTLLKNSGLTSLAFHVNDEESDPGSLTVTAQSSDSGVVSVVVSGADTQRALNLFPTPDATGSATITVAVSDGVDTAIGSLKVTVVPPPAAKPPPWLVLLYLAGDDRPPPPGGGDADMSTAINNLLLTLGTMPANSAMRLVVLSDGNQVGDSRIMVREPGATTFVSVEKPQPWTGGWPSDNELNTGNVATLRNFLVWARSTYPGSTHTLLSMVDHGGGWAPDLGEPGQPRAGTGGAPSNYVRAGGWRGLSLDVAANDGVGDALSTRNLGEALSGQPPIDVLFLDACLMGMIETADEAQPYARYLVAGENLLWAQLPYDRYLAPDALQATTSPAQLATTIVQRYNQPAYPDEPFTIAALDLAKLPDLRNQTDALAQQILAALPPAAGALQATPPTTPTVPLSNAVRLALTNAYRAAQKFDADATYRIDPTESSVDLADFARQLLRPENRISPQVTAAAQTIVTAVTGAQPGTGVVVATSTISGTSNWSPQPWNFAGATGLAIYLPLGELDCRPTGQPIVDMNYAAVAPCVALPNSVVGQPIVEPQLIYYANPGQLVFSRNAPHWIELLLRLQGETPPRTAALGSVAQAQTNKLTYYRYVPLALKR